MYKIIGADKNEYGPVSADQIRQWIAEGRINAQTQVWPEGAANWIPISALPEFAEALARLAPPSTVTPPAMGAPAPAQFAYAGTGDYDLDIGGCIGRGWELMKSNFGLVVGATIVYGLIQFGVSMLGKIPKLGIVVTLCNYVFLSGPLMAGLYFLFLRAIRRQGAEVGDLFSGFSNNYLQLVLTYVVMVLLMLLAALPGIAIFVVGLMQTMHHHAAEPLPMALMALGSVVALIPSVYLSVGWMFSLALVIDKGMEFWPAMSLSRRMVGKHWWTVFALLIVCGLINVLGLLACCVGLLASVPTGFGALMYAYEDIFSSSGAAPA